MQCPDCNGPMWDNRPKKANGTYKPTRSDYSCKDKDGCGKGVWLDKKPAQQSSASNGQSHAPTRALGPVYNECLDFQKRALMHHFGKDVATSDIIAATATLFIQAAQTRQPIRVMKPVPPPPPPPPPPPAEQYYEPDDADLPF